MVGVNMAFHDAICECFEGTMLEPRLLKPCFHVAGREPILSIIILILILLLLLLLIIISIIIVINLYIYTYIYIYIYIYIIICSNHVYSSHVFTWPALASHTPQVLSACPKP